MHGPRLLPRRFPGVGLRLACPIWAVCIWAAAGGHSAPMKFTDVTAAAGIAHLHTTSATEDLMARRMAGGAVAEDFDGDGWMDLYVLQGGTGPNLLYINKGDGTFADEAEARGAAVTMPGMGAAAADFDSDGDIDICVSSASAPHLLLINEDGGFFTADWTTLAQPTGIATSPSWGDVDNDGLLDLAIGRWSDAETQNLFIYRNLGGHQLQLYPFHAVPHHDRWVFSPRFADVNNDGWSDLLVTCDFKSSTLYLNQGDGSGRFAPASHAGIGTDENGMGAAVGDYDNDGDLDWFISSIFDPSGTVEGTWGVSGNRLYRNGGQRRGRSIRFVDVTERAGVADGNWGWGSVFGDLDNDGDLDLFHVNGWMETPHKFNHQPARLFENRGDGTFHDTAEEAGAGNRGQGRATLLFDCDNDGDLDIFICNNQELFADGEERIIRPGRPVLLRNESMDANHWLSVVLTAETPLHRQGISSRVYVQTDGPAAPGARAETVTLSPKGGLERRPRGSRVQMRELNASTGYLGHGPERIAHFGLGAATIVLEVLVQWLNGDTTRLVRVPVDQKLPITGSVATVSKRVAVVGEALVASGAGVPPLGTRREWVVGRRRFADPATLAFGAPGSKQLRLDVFGKTGLTVVRSETILVQISN